MLSFTIIIITTVFTAYRCQNIDPKLSRESRALKEEVSLLSKLHRAKSEAFEVINLIHHRYEMGNDMLFQYFKIVSNIAE